MYLAIGIILALVVLIVIGLVLIRRSDTSMDAAMANSRLAAEEAKLALAEAKLEQLQVVAELPTSSSYFEEAEE